MIFVTGGTGLVGSRLLAQLVADESNEIVALKRKKSDLRWVNKVFFQHFSNPDLYLKRIQWVDGDILDYFFLEELIPAGVEVYHAAAKVSFQKKEAALVMQTNVEGTHNLVNVCLKNKVRKLAYVSSIAALGRGEVNHATTENDFRTTSKGTSVYSASKYEAEMEVWRGIAEGLNAVIINPAVILGSGNWKKGSTELFNTVYKGLKFYTKGTNGYVSAEDVAKALILLMKSDISSERFILSQGNYSYQFLFDMIAKGLRVKVPNFYASPFLSEIAWRSLSFISFFTRKQPLITKETAHSANAFYNYSSEKFLQKTEFEFMPIEETIAAVCKEYLRDHQKA